MLPQEDRDKIGEYIVSKMLELIGENPAREGLKDTPKRVVKMWGQMFEGYDPTRKPKITTFPNGQDGIFYNQMITDSGHTWSMCEHHALPFEVIYHFGYIPADIILGLSKVARIVKYFSRKLQIQERLVKEIVDELESILKPRAIGLVLNGRHLCKSMRGVEMEGNMTTSDLRGEFRDEPETRAEFLSFVNQYN